MNILAVDLDRTVIYSNKFLEMHPTKSNIIRVEKTTSNESFISVSVIEAIQRAKDLGICIVPITSRSIEEYKRISIPGVSFEYAVTSAGGVILHNGEIDQEWASHIDCWINPDAMESLMSSLNSMDGATFKSKVVNGIYVFTKVGDINKAKCELPRIRETHPSFDIQMDKHKVYATSYKINKGEALMWLGQKLNADYIYAFGDSMMDVSMILAGDKGFTPTHNTIDKDILDNNNIVIVDGGTDSLIEVIRQIS